MESSIGFMAVFAVSGSVVLLAAHLHKRFLSCYMQKLELQFGMKNKKKEKKVSFAEDVMEPLGNNKEYRRKNKKSKLEDGGTTRRSSQKSRVL